MESVWLTLIGEIDSSIISNWLQEGSKSRLVNSHKPLKIKLLPRTHIHTHNKPLKSITNDHAGDVDAVAFVSRDAFAFIDDQHPVNPVVLEVTPKHFFSSLLAIVQHEAQNLALIRWIDLFGNAIEAIYTECYTNHHINFQKALKKEKHQTQKSTKRKINPSQLKENDDSVQINRLYSNTPDISAPIGTSFAVLPQTSTQTSALSFAAKKDSINKSLSGGIFGAAKSDDSCTTVLVAKPKKKIDANSTTTTTTTTTKTTLTTSTQQKPSTLRPQGAWGVAFIPDNPPVDENNNKGGKKMTPAPHNNTQKHNTQQINPSESVHILAVKSKSKITTQTVRLESKKTRETSPLSQLTPPPTQLPQMLATNAQLTASNSNPTLSSPAHPFDPNSSCGSSFAFTATQGNISLSTNSKGMPEALTPYKFPPLAQIQAVFTHLLVFGLQHQHILPENLLPLLLQLANSDMYALQLQNQYLSAFQTISGALGGVLDRVKNTKLNPKTLTMIILLNQMFTTMTHSTITPFSNAFSLSGDGKPKFDQNQAGTTTTTTTLSFPLTSLNNPTPQQQLSNSVSTFVGMYHLYKQANYLQNIPQNPPPHSTKLVSNTQPRLHHIFPTPQSVSSLVNNVLGATLTTWVNSPVSLTHLSNIKLLSLSKRVTPRQPPRLNPLDTPLNNSTLLPDDDLPIGLQSNHKSTTIAPKLKPPSSPKLPLCRPDHIVTQSPKGTILRAHQKYLFNPNLRMLLQTHHTCSIILSHCLLFSREQQREFQIIPPTHSSPLKLTVYNTEKKHDIFNHQHPPQMPSLGLDLGDNHHTTSVSNLAIHPSEYTDDSGDILNANSNHQSTSSAISVTSQNSLGGSHTGSLFDTNTHSSYHHSGSYYNANPQNHHKKSKNNHLPLLVPILNAILKQYQRSITSHITHLLQTDPINRNMKSLTDTIPRNHYERLNSHSSNENDPNNCISPSQTGTTAASSPPTSPHLTGDYPDVYHDTFSLGESLEQQSTRSMESGHHVNPSLRSRTSQHVINSLNTQRTALTLFGGNMGNVDPVGVLTQGKSISKLVLQKLREIKAQLRQVTKIKVLLPSILPTIPNYMIDLDDLSGSNQPNLLSISERDQRNSSPRIDQNPLFLRYLESSSRIIQHTGGEKATSRLPAKDSSNMVFDSRLSTTSRSHSYPDTPSIIDSSAVSSSTVESYNYHTNPAEIPPNNSQSPSCDHIPEKTVSTTYDSNGSFDSPQQAPRPSPIHPSSVSTTAKFRPIQGQIDPTTMQFDMEQLSNNHHLPQDSLLIPPQSLTPKFSTPRHHTSRLQNRRNLVGNDVESLNFDDSDEGDELSTQLEETHTTSPQLIPNPSGSQLVPQQPSKSSSDMTFLSHSSQLFPSMSYHYSRLTPMSDIEPLFPTSNYADLDWSNQITYHQGDLLLNSAYISALFSPLRDSAVIPVLLPINLPDIQDENSNPHENTFILQYPNTTIVPLFTTLSPFSQHVDHRANSQSFDSNMILSQYPLLSTYNSDTHTILPISITYGPNEGERGDNDRLLSTNYVNPILYGSYPVINLSSAQPQLTFSQSIIAPTPLGIDLFESMQSDQVVSEGLVGAVVFSDHHVQTENSEKIVNNSNTIVPNTAVSANKDDVIDWLHFLIASFQQCVQLNISLTDLDFQTNPRISTSGKLPTPPQAVQHLLSSIPADHVFDQTSQGDFCPYCSRHIQLSQSIFSHLHHLVGSFFSTLATIPSRLDTSSYQTAIPAKKTALSSIDDIRHDELLIFTIKPMRLLEQNYPWFISYLLELFLKTCSKYVDSPPPLNTPSHSHLHRSQTVSVPIFDERYNSNKPPQCSRCHPPRSAHLCYCSTFKTNLRGLQQFFAYLVLQSNNYQCVTLFKQSLQEKIRSLYVYDHDLKITTHQADGTKTSHKDWSDHQAEVGNDDVEVSVLDQNSHLGQTSDTVDGGISISSSSSSNSNISPYGVNSVQHSIALDIQAQSPPPSTQVYHRPSTFTDESSSRRLNTFKHFLSTITTRLSKLRLLSRLLSFLHFFSSHHHQSQTYTPHQVHTTIKQNILSNYHNGYYYPTLPQPPQSPILDELFPVIVYSVYSGSLSTALPWISELLYFLPLDNSFDERSVTNNNNFNFYLSIVLFIQLWSVSIQSNGTTNNMVNYNHGGFLRSHRFPIQPTSSQSLPSPVKNVKNVENRINNESQNEHFVLTSHLPTTFRLNSPIAKQAREKHLPNMPLEIPVSMLLRQSIRLSSVLLHTSSCNWYLPTAAPDEGCCTPRSALPVTHQSTNTIPSTVNEQLYPLLSLLSVDDLKSDNNGNFDSIATQNIDFITSRGKFQYNSSQELSLQPTDEFIILNETILKHHFSVNKHYTNSLLQPFLLINQPLSSLSSLPSLPSLPPTNPLLPTPGEFINWLTLQYFSVQPTAESLRLTLLPFNSPTKPAKIDPPGEENILIGLNPADMMQGSRLTPCDTHNNHKVIGNNQYSSFKQRHSFTLFEFPMDFLPFPIISTNRIVIPYTQSLITDILPPFSPCPPRSTSKALSDYHKLDPITSQLRLFSSHVGSRAVQNQFFSPGKPPINLDLILLSTNHTFDYLNIIKQTQPSVLAGPVGAIACEDDTVHDIELNSDVIANPIDQTPHKAHPDQIVILQTPHKDPNKTISNFPTHPTHSTQSIVTTNHNTSHVSLTKRKIRPSAAVGLTVPNNQFGEPAEHFGDQWTSVKSSTGDHAEMSGLFHDSSPNHSKGVDIVEDRSALTPFRAKLVEIIDAFYNFCQTQTYDLSKPIIKNIQQLLSSHSTSPQALLFSQVFQSNMLETRLRNSSCVPLSALLEDTSLTTFVHPYSTFHLFGWALEKDLIELGYLPPPLQPFFSTSNPKHRVIAHDSGTKQAKFDPFGGSRTAIVQSLPHLPHPSAIFGSANSPPQTHLNPEDSILEVLRSGRFNINLTNLPDFELSEAHISFIQNSKTSHYFPLSHKTITLQPHLLQITSESLPHDSYYLLSKLRELLLFQFRPTSKVPSSLDGDTIIHFLASLLKLINSPAQLQPLLPSSAILSLCYNSAYILASPTIPPSYTICSPILTMFEPHGGLTQDLLSQSTITSSLPQQIAQTHKSSHPNDDLVHSSPLGPGTELESDLARLLLLSGNTDGHVVDDLHNVSNGQNTHALFLTNPDAETSFGQNQNQTGDLFPGKFDVNFDSFVLVSQRADIISRQVIFDYFSHILTPHIPKHYRQSYPQKSTRIVLNLVNWHLFTPTLQQAWLESLFSAFPNISRVFHQAKDVIIGNLIQLTQQLNLVINYIDQFSNHFYPKFQSLAIIIGHFISATQKTNHFRPSHPSFFHNDGSPLIDPISAQALFSDIMSTPSIPYSGTQAYSTVLLSPLANFMKISTSTWLHAIVTQVLHTIMYKIQFFVYFQTAQYISVNLSTQLIAEFGTGVNNAAAIERQLHQLLYHQCVVQLYKHYKDQITLRYVQSRVFTSQFLTLYNKINMSISGAKFNNQKYIHSLLSSSVQLFESVLSSQFKAVGSNNIEEGRFKPSLVLTPSPQNTLPMSFIQTSNQIEPHHSTQLLPSAISTPSSSTPKPTHNQRTKFHNPILFTFIPISLTPSHPTVKSRISILMAFINSIYSSLVIFNFISSQNLSTYLSIQSNYTITPAPYSAPKPSHTSSNIQSSSKNMQFSSLSPYKLDLRAQLFPYFYSIVHYATPDSNLSAPRSFQDTYCSELDYSYLLPHHFLPFGKLAQNRDAQLNESIYLGGKMPDFIDLFLAQAGPLVPDKTSEEAIRKYLWNQSSFTLQILDEYLTAQMNDDIVDKGEFGCPIDVAVTQSNLDIHKLSLSKHISKSGRTKHLKKILQHFQSYFSPSHSSSQHLASTNSTSTALTSSRHSAVILVMYHVFRVGFPEVFEPVIKLTDFLTLLLSSLYSLPHASVLISSIHQVGRQDGYTSTLSRKTSSHCQINQYNSYTYLLDLYANILDIITTLGLQVNLPRIGQLNNHTLTSTPNTTMHFEGNAVEKAAILSLETTRSNRSTINPNKPTPGINLFNQFFQLLDDRYHVIMHIEPKPGHFFTMPFISDDSNAITVGFPPSHPAQGITNVRSTPHQPLLRLDSSLAHYIDVLSLIIESPPAACLDLTKISLPNQQFLSLVITDVNILSINVNSAQNSTRKSIDQPPINNDLPPQWESTILLFEILIYGIDIALVPIQTQQVLNAIKQTLPKYLLSFFSYFEQFINTSSSLSEVLLCMAEFQSECPNRDSFVGNGINTVSMLPHNSFCNIASTLDFPLLVTLEFFFSVFTSILFFSHLFIESLPGSLECQDCLPNFGNPSTEKRFEMLFRLKSILETIDASINRLVVYPSSHPILYNYIIYSKRLLNILIDKSDGMMQLL